MKRLTTLASLALLALCASAQTFVIDGLEYAVLFGSSNEVSVRAADGSLTTANILASVTYDGNDYDVTYTSSGAFEGCTSLTSVTIPNSVTSIGSSTFTNCTHLSSVTIPNSVISIGSEAFRNCTSLTSVTIPSSVTSIGNYAFLDCYFLSDSLINNSTLSSGNWGATIADSATDDGLLIKDNKIVMCRPSATSVGIPADIDGINAYAFGKCDKLSRIYIYATTPTDVEEKAFYDLYDLTYRYGFTLFVPSGAKSAYQNADVWSNFTDIREMSDMNYQVISEDDKTCRIVSKEILYTGDIIIPAQIDGYKVVEIGDFAFRYNQMTSISIPNTVTTIGNYALFGCTSLTSVTIPESVTSIGSSTFANCTHLSSVTIPNSVTTIGNGAFQNCHSLTSFTIPASVTSIGSITFASCYFAADSLFNNSTLSGDWGEMLADTETDEGLLIRGYEILFCRPFATSVTIPDNIDAIYDGAFGKCDNLSKIYMNAATPPVVTDGAFYDNENCVYRYDITLFVPYGAKSAYQDANVWSNFTDIREMSDMNYEVISEDDKTCRIVEKEGGYEGDIIIPAQIDGYKVVEIGDYAFYGCRNLTSVEIPNTVTRIGYMSFFNSTLQSVTMPTSLTEIASYAFYSASQLTSITIPGSVARIEESAFSYCSRLQTVNIENGVSDIISYAFYSCTALTSVTLPSSLTTIGKEAFKICSSLASITLPPSLTSLGKGAFEDCISLSSITLPSSLTQLDESLFKGCYFVADSLVNNSSFTSDNYWDATIIPEETADGLIIRNNEVIDCRRWATAVTFPDYVETIKESAFEKCTNLTTVTLNEKLKTIEMFAFSNCSALTSIVIPDSVTSIGYCAFDNCTSLASVTLGNSLGIIGEYAFCDCSSLTSVTIPGSVKTIDSNAFYNCISLKTLNICEGVESIGWGAFSYCSDITSITIPSSVTSIRNYALDGCYFTADSFINNSSLTDDDYWGAIIADAENGDGVLVKGDSTVVCRSWATSVVIPPSTTIILPYAFYTCKNLTQVYALPTTPPDIFSTSFKKDDDDRKYHMTLFVPQGTIERYAGITTWANFIEIKEMESPVITETYADSSVTYIIADGSDITLHDSNKQGSRIVSVNINDDIEANVSYTRTIKNNNWQPLYLPFDFTVGSDSLVEYAEIWDTKVDPATRRVSSIEFVTLEPGSQIPAHTPLIVRATPAGITAETPFDLTIQSSESWLEPVQSDYIDCTTTKQYFKFVGVYESTPMKENSGYYLSNGSLQYATRDDIAVSPFRFYMQIYDRKTGELEYDGDQEVKINVWGYDHPNVINSVKLSDDLSTKGVYDLSGRLLSHPKKGINIVDGKRVFIK